jgi:dihydroorotate dehydrogenase electron transfer subunit
MECTGAELVQIHLESHGAGGRILCPPGLIPSAGQYVLGQADPADGTPPAPLLPVPVFAAGASPGGFLAAAPLPPVWTPGTRLRLRGPLGRGFSLPREARRVALLAFDDGPARLLPLIPAALQKEASVVLLTDDGGRDLPEEVEVQPRAAVSEVLHWADYLAVIARRESLEGLRDLIGNQIAALSSCEILVDAPVPCGGLADCGVCAIHSGREWKMACKDGPVFDGKDLIG